MCFLVVVLPFEEEKKINGTNLLSAPKLFVKKLWFPLNNILFDGL